MSSLLYVTLADGVLRLTLARPDVNNALNGEFIVAITQTLRDHAERSDVRVLVLAAEGTAFCAGADFNWMSAQKHATVEENLADAQAIFDMFYELYDFPHPTIARVQGNAFGGGSGLVAACDVAVIADSAMLAFSEVRIGLVPATISPFVIRKIGEGRAREYFLTGQQMSADRAREIGLVNKVVPAEMLDTAVNDYISMFEKGGAQAHRVTKDLLREVPRLPLAEAREFTAARIANQRVSEEGQEGMAAFLEKRKPKWVR